MSYKSEETNNDDPTKQKTPKINNEDKNEDPKIHLAGEYDGEFNIKQEIPRHTISTIQTAGDAIQPFLPFFSQVTDIVKSLLQTNETAKCNQKICLALIDRVEIAQQAVNSLKRQQLANEKLFRDQDYYYAWVRFINVLENIRKFAKDVTQLSSIQKYISAMTVKEAFDKNIKEFEDVCNDLHFSLAIYNNERREIETKKVMEDIDILLKNMGDLSSDIRLVMKELTQLSTNIGELTKQIVKPESGSMGTEDTAKLKLNNAYKAPDINPTDLEPYPFNKETGKNIIKRVYKGVEVACKKILVIENNDTVRSQIDQHELAILLKLGYCPYIIAFHGLSIIDNSHVMVFDWARNGNLKKLYMYNNIDWPTKLKIARDICNGLLFIHRCNILHHDIRCENILITDGYEPKISNFELSHTEHEKSLEVKSILDLIRWLAPEKMSNDSKKRYNLNRRYDHHCEMFSFGMLLWELCHQRIPYKDMNTVAEIQDHVMNQRREVMEILINPNPIPQVLSKIIKKAWDHEPSQRPKVMEMLSDLKNLHDRYVPNGTSPKVRPKGESSDIPGLTLSSTTNNQKLKSTKVESTFGLPEDCEELTLDNISTIPVIHTLRPFEDGHKAHQVKKYNVAWECFSGHAECGNNYAKYWKGYYLLNGIHVKKDVNAALKLFKDAADNGVVDAQLRYSFTLIENGSKNFSEIVKYMTLAADNGNSTALYNLGDIYLNGRFGVTVNEIKAKECIQLAALKNQPKAVAFLEKLNASK